MFYYFPSWLTNQFHWRSISKLNIKDNLFNIVTFRVNACLLWTLKAMTNKCPKRKSLFTGTVPANKNYITGTVPANKSYVTGTVPANKNYITGTVPANKSYVTETDPRVVRTPRYKNFVQSFRESTGAASIVDLYLGLLYHSAAGLSWLNIRIFWTW